jgi:hypothetical protein
VCGGLQNIMDLGETIPSVWCETSLTDTAGGSEVSGVKAEEVLRTQEQDHMPVALPAVKAADKVCYVCNIVVFTVVQDYTVTSAFWQCVVWCLGVTVL